MTFPIDEGVVKVSAEIDKGSIRAAATSAGRQAGDDLEKSTRDSFGKSASANRGMFSNILRKAVTPSAGAFDALRAPFAAALSTPIGAAMVGVAGLAAVAFIGAFVAALATAGLGAIFLGIGIIALKENEKIAKSFEALGTRVKKAFAGATAPLIAPLITAMNMLGDAAERVAPLLKSIFAGLAPVIPALTAGMIGFVEEFLKVLTADPTTLQGMRDTLIAIADNLPRLGTALGQMFALFASNQNNVRNIGILFNILIFAIGQLAATVIVFSTILDGLVIAWHAVQNAVTAFVGWLTGTAGPAIRNFFTVTIPGAINTAVGFFAALPGRIGAAIAAIPGLLGALFRRAFDLITTAIGVGIGTAVRLMITMPGKIVSAIVSIPGRVASVFNSVRSTMVSLINGAVNAGVAIFRGLPGKVGSALSTVRSRVQGAFSGAGSWLVSAGRAIIQGVISGIGSAIGGAVAAARRAAANIVAGFKSALKIGSPSKVFAGLGVDTLRGLANGLSQTQIVDRAMRGVADTVSGFGGLGMTSPAGATVGTVPVGSTASGSGAAGGGGVALSVGSVTIHVGVVDPSSAAQVGGDIMDGFIRRIAQVRTAR